MYSQRLTRVNSVFSPHHNEVWPTSMFAMIAMHWIELQSMRSAFKVRVPFAELHEHFVVWPTRNTSTRGHTGHVRDAVKWCCAFSICMRHEALMWPGAHALHMSRVVHLCIDANIQTLPISDWLRRRRAHTSTSDVDRQCGSGFSSFALFAVIPQETFWHDCRLCWIACKMQTPHTHTLTSDRYEWRLRIADRTLTRCTIR